MPQAQENNLKELSPSERAYRFIKRWNMQITGEEELTEEMQRTCARLMPTFLADEDGLGDEYAAEKFMKLFLEPMIGLWRTRCRQEVGFLPSEAYAKVGGSSGSAGGQMAMDEYLRRLDRAKDQWRADLGRQVRMWTNVLSAVSVEAQFKLRKALAEKVAKRPAEEDPGTED